jgi:hypothetical protein
MRAGRAMLREVVSPIVFRSVSIARLSFAVSQKEVSRI